MTVYESCPFCGESIRIRLTNELGLEPTQKDYDKRDGKWYVRCDGCGAQGPFSNQPERPPVYWNKRLKLYRE